jgi:replicative DNA helicase
MHSTVHMRDPDIHRVISMYVNRHGCNAPSRLSTVWRSRGCDRRSGCGHWCLVWTHDSAEASGAGGVPDVGGRLTCGATRLSHPRVINYASTTVGVRAVSVTNEVRASGAATGGPGAPGEPGFDRTPPQDIAAEQCVLGGMLLSKDAIADVLEILRTGDFYRPAHATIFDIVLDLYGRGEPADPITVAAALTDAGDLARVGGAAYLHTLISSVPTAANSSYYARIVAERAVLRRLVEAGTRIVQMGYGSAAGQGRDVDDLVDLAQQAVYDVTERRGGDDFAILADLLQPALDEIEAVGSRDGVMAGVPTGFGDLDRLLNGLHPGQLVIVAGRPGLGKALALDTPLPTPHGWTTMGEVAVGDELIDANGRPTVVTAVSDVMNDRPCYEVEFSDGSTIVADGSHRWLTSTRASRRYGRPPAVVTTDEILATLWDSTAADRRRNHAIAVAAALQLPERDLPVAPYTLGVWLVGGRLEGGRFTTADAEIITYIEEEGYVVHSDDRMVYSILVPPLVGCSAGQARSGSVAGTLQALGGLGEKHMPQAYLRASQRQRLALLAGLLDAGATVTPTGSMELAVTSRGLAYDVHELVVSLGYRGTVTTKRVEGGSQETATGTSREAATVYTVNVLTSDDLFRLERKRLEHKQRCRTHDDSRNDPRYIASVRRVETVPVRCVSVDNADHLYLAGRSMIPTHNSTAALDFARTASVRHNLASAVFSLEMSKIEIVTRLLSAESRVPLHVLRSGQLSDDDWTRLARRMGEISEAPMFVDDTPNMTLMEIRAKARRMRQRHDLKLVIVDYLQLMTSPRKVESRQQEVADLSRGLKLLAKEIECPVVAVSQLNRGPEQRTDKRPQLSDLRESGCLTASTRLVRADTNEQVTLGELCATGATDVPVWALDERLKYVPRTLTHAFPSGRTVVYRMRLASGKEIEATSNHRFLTVDGWTALERLARGSRIAVSRHLPPPLDITECPDDHVILLAHLLGTRPHKMLVPAQLSSLPKRQVGLFLRHLWATDGSVTVGASNGRISYASTSKRLLDDVGILLLRFGIVSSLRTVTGGQHRPQYVLDVSGRDDQLRFLREIGVHGALGAGCDALRAVLEGPQGNASVDTVPSEIWTRVERILAERATGHRASSRQRLARVATVLAAADLDLHATNDVFWDEIASIEEIGETDVYDATVLGLHNFIANGLVAHNSIEQDADVVILLHRDDYYDKESPRAGEADFIVAKHRNGPLRGHGHQLTPDEPRTHGAGAYDPGISGKLAA